jgi:hypothetical protein
MLEWWHIVEKKDPAFRKLPAKKKGGWGGWDLAEWLESLTANAEVASSDTAVSEGRQMKQCWIQYIEKREKNSPLKKGVTNNKERTYTGNNLTCLCDADPQWYRYRTSLTLHACAFSRWRNAGGTRSTRRPDQRDPLPLFRLLDTILLQAADCLPQTFHVLSKEIASPDHPPSLPTKIQIDSLLRL